MKTQKLKVAKQAELERAYT